MYSSPKVFNLTFDSSKDKLIVDSALVSANVYGYPTDVGLPPMIPVIPLIGLFPLSDLTALNGLFTLIIFVLAVSGLVLPASCLLKASDFLA